jgi:hypothetical protein
LPNGISAIATGSDPSLAVVSSSCVPFRSRKNATRRPDLLMSPPPMAAAIGRGVPPSAEISQIVPSSPDRSDGV